MQISDSTLVSLVVVLGWVLSLCLHEYGHGIVAYWGGDKSIKDKGYLSFNPFAYTDVGMSIVLPAVIVLFGGIGLPGAAVSVNTTKLRNKYWESLVSLAGPVFSIAFTVVLVAGIHAWSNAPVNILAAATFLAVLEILVIILNLLPVPGLDGYGIFEPFLPSTLRQRLIPAQRYGILLLMAVLWMVPPANDFLWLVSYAISYVVGLEPRLIDRGQTLFREGAGPLAIGVIAIVVIYHFVKSRREKNAGDVVG